MKFFIPLYLRMSRKRFDRQFRPFGSVKKPNYLVSMPEQPADFLAALPLINGLRVSGAVFLLIPRGLHNLYSLLRHNIFQVFIYESPPELFSKEYHILKTQLEPMIFNLLIELNKPANISLPYLINADKRICCDTERFPYYNIFIKDGFLAICDFFKIKKTNPQELFHFNVRSLKKLEKRFKQERPILLVNKDDEITWPGGRIVIGKDIQASDPDIYETVYLTDAYYGIHDQFYQFARIFNKNIVGP